MGRTGTEPSPAPGRIQPCPPCPTLAQHFVALARLLDLDPNVSVDLVEIEQTSDSLRSRILSEGQVL